MPTLVGNRVRISGKNCNIALKDPDNWFDTGALLQDYDLDLSNPFERSIAIFLTYLVPNHQTFVVSTSSYFDPERKVWTSMQLKEVVDKEYFHRMESDPTQLKVIEGLRKIIEAASDINKAVELFQEMDADGSGQLDEGEFGELLQAIGEHMSPLYNYILWQRSNASINLYIYVSHRHQYR